MHKPIHEVYHYGNDRRERDMTEAEFIAWFDTEVMHHGVHAYAGTHELGKWVTIPRAESVQLLLWLLIVWERLEYGWSTYTLNEEG